MRQATNWLQTFINPVLWKPRPADPSQGLFMDLDGSLHKDRRFFVRPKQGIVNPPTQKPLWGFMPMNDAFSVSIAFGKKNSGPGVDTPISLPTKTIYPQLPKNME